VNEIYFGHVPSLIFVERSTNAIIITKKVGKQAPMIVDIGKNVARKKNSLGSFSLTK
tara:strand:- start:347 stop:517 length:171 start_codon:yes stop_codon:yes gene_type:complete